MAGQPAPCSFGAAAMNLGTITIDLSPDAAHAFHPASSRVPPVATIAEVEAGPEATDDAQQPVMAAPAQSRAEWGMPVEATPALLPLWTDERRAVVRREYALGTPRTEILRQVNELPGRAVLLPQLVVLVGNLKLKRPAGHVQPDDVDQAVVVHELGGGQTVTGSSLTVLTPIGRSKAEILKWCAMVRFNAEPFDLDAINAYRATKKMAPYVIGTEDTDAAAEPGALSARVVTYEQALSWANQRGLCSDGVLDLRIVNAKAAALGVATFEIRAPTGPGRRA